MAYVKTKWKNDVTKLNATNMNHIEDGIYNNDQAIAELSTKTTEIEGSLQKIEGSLSDLSTAVETNTADIEDLKNRPVDPINIVSPGEESFDENSVKRLYRDGTAPHELHDPYFINMPELTEPESFYIGKKADGSDMVDSAQVNASNISYAWDGEFFNVFEEFDADMGDTCGSIFNSKIEVPVEGELQEGEEPVYEKALKFGSNKKTGLLRLRARSKGTILLNVCKYYIYKEIIDEETGESHFEKSYDDKAVIKVNDIEYELGGEYTNLSLEFEAGDTITIESVEKTYEEETDPETGEPVYILVKGGRFYLNTVKSIHEQVYEKKQVATREQVHELDEALNLTNEQVSANSANIAQNASDIEVINDKLGTVQIYEILSEHMIEPSEDFIGKLVRYQGKLYRAVKTVTEPQSIKFNLFIDKDQWAEQHEGAELPEMFTVESFDSFAQQLLDTEGNYWLSDCIEATELNTVGFRYGVDSNVALGIGSSSKFGSATFKFGTGSPVESPLQYINIKGRAWGNDVAYVNFKCPYNKIDTYTFIPTPDERDSFEAVNFNVKLIPSEDKEFNIQTIAYNLPPSIITKRIAISELEFVYGTAEYEWEAISGGSGDSLFTKITWGELKELRDNAKLIPGMKYQITDYECTTTQQNTSSAGHQFDIIVEALSEKDLSEDAKATYHEGDRYFQTEVQKIISADWIDPNIQPENIHIIYDMTDEGKQYFPPVPAGSEESSSIITAIGTKINEDGVEVPAIFNPDPDGQGHDVWYIYSGTQNIPSWTNNLVSVQYAMWEDGGEPSYTPEHKYYEKDIFVKMEYINDTPTLYKEDVSVYGKDSYDSESSFTYIGDQEIDGINYNKWQKNDTEGPEVIVLTQVIVVDNRFIITQEQLTAAVVENNEICDKWAEDNGSGFYHLTTKIVDANIKEYLKPVANMNAWQLKYCLDNDTSKFYWASDKEGAWYGQVFLYTQSIEIDGTTYYQFDREDYDNSIYSIKRYPMKNDSVYVLEDGKMVADDTFDKDYVYQGKGVIYQMIDEWQNEAPYDFKNILIYSNLYTFSQGAFGSYSDASIGKICKNNKIEATNSISRKGSRNDPNYIGLNYFVNLDGFIIHNYIGLNSYKNVIGSIEEYNRVLSSNYIADGCNFNTVTGSYNKINNGGVSNAITGEYNIISFNGSNIGITGSYNTFGSSCDNVAISNGSYNVIDDNCSYLWINATDDTWFTNVHVHSGIQGSKNQRRWINTDDATGSSSKSIDVYASNSVSIVLEDTY